MGITTALFIIAAGMTALFFVRQANARMMKFRRDARAAAAAQAALDARPIAE